MGEDEKSTSSAAVENCTYAYIYNKGKRFEGLQQSPRMIHVSIRKLKLRLACFIRDTGNSHFRQTTTEIQQHFRNVPVSRWGGDMNGTDVAGRSHTKPSAPFSISSACCSNNIGRWNTCEYDHRSRRQRESGVDAWVYVRRPWETCSLTSVVSLLLLRLSRCISSYG